MGYSNRYSGQILIDPPLSAAEIRTAPRAEESWDAHLRVDPATEHTPDGETTTTTAGAIIGPDEPCNGYDVQAQIQALVDLFGARHRFSGHVQVDRDGGFREPPSCYVVRDGRVVEVQPQIIWPGDGA